MAVLTQCCGSSEHQWQLSKQVHASRSVCIIVFSGTRPQWQSFASHWRPADLQGCFHSLLWLLRSSVAAFQAITWLQVCRSVSIIVVMVLGLNDIFVSHCRPAGLQGCFHSMLWSLSTPDNVNHFRNWNGFVLSANLTLYFHTCLLREITCFISSRMRRHSRLRVLVALPLSVRGTRP